VIGRVHADLMIGLDATVHFTLIRSFYVVGYIKMCDACRY
jgi:hypothetical protein